MLLTQILLSPVITEKTSLAQEQRKYAFRVHAWANKIQVAQAVESAYGVKVDSVNLILVKPKHRLVGRGRTVTKRQASKRAIVTLQPNQTLDFNKVKAPK